MEVIAHRGASGYAPENTRAAFDRALAMGADAIETDVQLTADQELVLFHDATVDRSSDGRGPVADYSLAELRTLDLGGWFGPAFAGERVVRVEEMLDEYLPRIPIVFEIKDPAATRPLVAALLADGRLDRVQVTSFFWGPLLTAAALAPTLSLGFLTRSGDPDLLTRIARRGFAQIWPHVDALTPGRVADAKTRGLAVRAWGVEGRHQVDRLFATGVDGATVDRPDWIAEHAGNR
jgi:glycerophosphoryl diester phosphodiesterase